MINVFLISQEMFDIFIGCTYSLTSLGLGTTSFTETFKDTAAVLYNMSQYFLYEKIIEQNILNCYCKSV